MTNSLHGKIVETDLNISKQIGSRLTANNNDGDPVTPDTLCGRLAVLVNDGSETLRRAYQNFYGVRKIAECAPPQCT
ncbi:MAG: hypothetical protein PF501_09505 [Salinisphaera sp.]|nr:hypothetical protein [Salinisphaera sp.]